METVVMVIGEEMFSWRQEGGEGGEGTVEMYGESSKRRMDKGAGLGEIVRVESRERILPSGPQSAFGFKIQILTPTKPNNG